MAVGDSDMREPIPLVPGVGPGAARGNFGFLNEVAFGVVGVDELELGGPLRPNHTPRQSSRLAVTWLVIS